MKQKLETPEIDDSGWQVPCPAPQVWGNPGDGSALRLISNGPFVMGSSQEEIENASALDKDGPLFALAHETPQFVADLPNYYVGICAVTNEQFARFLTVMQPSMDLLDLWFPWRENIRVPIREGASYTVVPGFEIHPVNSVSWVGAQAYCGWAGLRLPTEIEWEKAVRGVDGRIFPWGDEWDPEVLWWWGSHGRGNATAPVDMFPDGRSPYGLYQMAGNVEEWCVDWYQPAIYTRYAAGNLHLPNHGRGRVLRGGNGMRRNRLEFRCAMRRGNSPSFTNVLLTGFRCACDVRTVLQAAFFTTREKNPGGARWPCLSNSEHRTPSSSIQPLMDSSASTTIDPSSKVVRTSWLNRTVLGIGLASLLSDASHEMATSLMPAFLATMGVATAWLGLIEGIADGLSSFLKMASGYYTDGLQRRKGIAVAGYLITTLGTAAFGLASNAWHVLCARTISWSGRGVRTPVRKALLAAAVTPETYGRAFGFERMMDTFGAIIGPGAAYFLFRAFDHHYSAVFAATLVPGLAAAFVIAFLVQEKERSPVPHISFGERLRTLPSQYRRFLLAIGLFGAGAFAHTLLIMLATQRLTPEWGAPRAAAMAVALYILHNIFYAAFSYLGGWLADRLPKNRLLAAGYSLAALMAIFIVALPASLWSMALIFVLGGIQVAVEETLEDSFCAELVDERHHGMAFGVLATVNGIGDFLSSTIVGLLWSISGIALAFSYSAVLFLIGAVLICRVKAPASSHGKSS